MKKTHEKEIIIIGVILILLLLICGFFMLVSLPIRYECNSGNIKMDLLINNSSFSHFQLNEIDGLTCKGEFPVYFLFKLE